MDLNLGLSDRRTQAYPYSAVLPPSSVRTGYVATPKPGAAKSHVRHCQRVRRGYAWLFKSGFPVSGLTGDNSLRFYSLS